MKTCYHLLYSPSVPIKLLQYSLNSILALKTNQESTTLLSNLEKDTITVLKGEEKKEGRRGRGRNQLLQNVNLYSKRVPRKTEALW